MRIKSPAETAFIHQYKQSRQNKEFIVQCLRFIVRIFETHKQQEGGQCGVFNLSSSSSISVIPPEIVYFRASPALICSILRTL